MHGGPWPGSAPGAWRSSSAARRAPPPPAARPRPPGPAEQEQQRAAGAWQAEWEPLSDLLRLTGSAASWGAELLAGLEVDPARMRENLAAARGLPMAEHVATLLAPALGPVAAHDLVAEASARAAGEGRHLRDTLLDSPELRERLDEARIAPKQVEAALDPAGFLGSAGEIRGPRPAAPTPPGPPR